MTEMTSHIDFRVFIRAYCNNSETNRRIRYKIKSKYPEKYSTVDKEGPAKTFSEEILFRAELIASSFLI